MLYRKEDFAKLNYNDKLEYFKKCEQEAIEYQTKTKAEMILEIAKTLKNSGYPVKEIKHKMLEDLGDLVTPRYVDMCLTDEYKPRAMVKKAAEEKKQQIAALAAAAGSTIGGGSETILEEPGNDNTNRREELSSTYQPSILGTNVTVPKTNYNEQQEQPAAINSQYVEDLERQIKALKGEIGYEDMLGTLKIVKIGRTNIQSLINASKKATKHVYITVDIRTNELVKIKADKDYRSEVIQKQEQQQEPEPEPEPESKKSTSKRNRRISRQ